MEESWPRATGLCSTGAFPIPVHLLNTRSPRKPPSRAAGGRFLTRGSTVKVFEAGIKDRSVVIEFDSPEKAIAAYESPAYQAALKHLEGAVERDVRILEGVSDQVA